MAGKVYLIGAGPGDPELLTLKAVKAIAQATVLLVDDLVNPAVLNYAMPHAQIIYVGKRGGCVSTSQTSIESLMLQEALQGKIVGRIKGGDPYIFGRGGEEVAALHHAGIEYEVINGITSGLAAATQFNIPLTHRDYTQGVVFVTGHLQQSTFQTVNWKALAESQMTLVIYMGITHADYIQQQLLLGGLSPDTPVAVIRNATGGSQGETVQSHFMTLNTLYTTIIQYSIKSPSIIVIGDVVKVGLNLN